MYCARPRRPGAPPHGSLTIHDVRSPPLELTPETSIVERFRVDPRERFSCYSHVFGAVGALVGVVALLIAAPSTLAWRLVAVTYAVGILSMFSASALYHAQKREEAGTGFWRRVDHSAVFLMIAGTYTPICFAYLEGAWFWGVAGAQWLLAISGIIFKLTSLGDRRWLTVAVYLAMGWMAVIPLPKLLVSMSPLHLALIAGGGISYTAGAIVYAFKRPDPWPDQLGFHGLFHIAIVIAAAMHFAVIYRAAAGIG